MNDKDSLLSSPQLDNNEQQSALALSPKQLHSLYEKSKQFNIPLEVLETVYLRGITGGDSGTGFGRVNSFIHGGQAAELDKDLKEDEDTKHYAIATRAKTKSGWKRVKDTKFSSEERAHEYGRKYHTDKSGSKFYKVVEHPDNKKKIHETTQGETVSDNPAEPASRFVGTDKLTSIYKNDTPGQETRVDVVKRVVRDLINKNKKDPE